MLKKNLFRTDSRPAPALWAALFHHDDKPAAATQKREKNPKKARKQPVDDSATAARERMVERGMNPSAKDATEEGEKPKIRKNYNGAWIMK